MVYIKQGLVNQPVHLVDHCTATSLCAVPGLNDETGNIIWAITLYGAFKWLMLVRALY